MNEVDQHPPHLFFGSPHLKAFIHLRDYLDVLRVAQLVHALDCLIDQLLQWVFHHAKDRLPRFDHREVEQFLHQPQQRIRLTGNRPQRRRTLLTFRFLLLVEQTVDSRPDIGDGSTEFVRDVRDHVPPCPIQPHQFGHVLQRHRDEEVAITPDHVHAHPVAALANRKLFFQHFLGVRQRIFDHRLKFGLVGHFDEAPPNRTNHVEQALGGIVDGDDLELLVEHQQGIIRGVGERQRQRDLIRGIICV